MVEVIRTNGGVRIGRETFSQAEFDVAQQNIQRSIEGKRMVGFQQKGISGIRSKAAFNLLLSDPELRKSFDVGRQLKTEARQKGFDSVQELLSLRGFAKSGVGKPAQIISVKKGFPTIKEERPTRKEEISFIKKRTKEVGLKQLRQEISERKGVIIPKEVEIKTREIPPTRIEEKISRVIKFPTPESIGRRFDIAKGGTGRRSFTIAIPTEEVNGKVRVTDFTFTFEGDKLINKKERGSILRDKEGFIERDKQRAKKRPEFGRTFVFEEEKIKGPPTVIGLPKEKIKQLPKAIGLPGEKFIPEKKPLALKVSNLSTRLKQALNLPEIKARPELLELSKGIEKLIPKEKRIEFIEIQPEIPTGTIIRRPVDIRDVDKGILPPQQELDLKVNDIITKFEIGTISEIQANKDVENAQKAFINREVRRTLPVEATISFGIGAVSAALPPVGIALGGLFGLEAIRKRRKLISFAKQNPKAATTLIVTNIVASLAGAGVVGFLKGGFVKLKEPTVKFSGKGKKQFTATEINQLDPEFNILLKNKRITNTRAFEIKIPNAQGKKITIKILSFVKDGKSKFFGQEIIDGKITKNIRGAGTIGKEGTFARVISNSVKKGFGGKIKDVEISTFLDKVNQKIIKSTPLKQILISDSEVKLANRFGLNKLSPKKFREAMRIALGDVKARAKSGKPFTEAEFNAAQKLSKLKVLSTEGVKKIRLISLKKQITLGLEQRKTILKIKTEEAGFGVIKVKLKKPLAIKGKIKEPIIIGKIPRPKLKSTSIFGKVRKIPPVKVPAASSVNQLRATLSQIARTSGKNVLLQRRPTLAGTFLAVGKETQNAALRQFKNLKIISTTLKTLPVSILNSFQRVAIQKERQKLKLRLSEVLKKKQIPIEEVISQQILREVSLIGLASLVSQAEKQKIAEVQLPKTLTKQVSKQMPKQISKQKITFKIIPKPIIKFPIPDLEEELKKKPIKKIKPIPLKKLGYDTLIKHKGKFRKANLVPLKKSRAIDLGAYITDRTTARTTKVIKTDKKAQKSILKFPQNYFGKTREKWRGNIIKGKEMPIKDKLIERRKFLIDTIGEKKQLSAAREIKRLQAPALIKFKKRRRR